MKKLLITAVLAVLTVSFAGCAHLSSIHFPDDTAVKSGKLVGVLVAAKYPSDAKLALPYAKGFLDTAKEGRVDDETFDSVVALLLQYCDTDEDIQIAIKSALTFVDIELTLGEVNTTLIDVIDGFIEGIEEGLPDEE